ncbi:patatin-like phospholipase family protein [Echinicola marina]|uniref:patatin-like phospholipase family protein n=1 Tax=Echinicola marina TaxID=2859768 RepID=UPI001CF7085B|nr:patatin-like phospholipase family protein [Echinicola marina]UCS91628.1 patatin-like phospholipase family protein [Echinicola marina]
MKKVKIISIDGGGVRGVIPALILQALEEKIQLRTKNKHSRLVDFVDFFAGTGSGGVITCALLNPDDKLKAKAKFSTEEVNNFFHEFCLKAYSKSHLHKIQTLGGLLNDKYTDKALNTLFTEQFADNKFSQLIKPCIIAAYDLDHRRAHFFNQHNAMITKAKDFHIKDVARVATATPTYFQAVNIKSELGISYPLIDGAVFANNPGMCAYAETRKMYFENIKNPISKDMYLLSLGTGLPERQYTFHEAKNFAPGQWTKPLLSIVRSGNAETVTHQLKWLFDAEKNKNGFLRINPDLKNASNKFDAASKSNLKALKEAVDDYISKNESLLNEIVQNLVPIEKALE